MQIKQKVEANSAIVKAMEEKEMRIFTQLEDLKTQKTYDQESQEQRIKDLQSVLDQKQQVGSDLEREVKSKDRMLSERQE